MSSNLLVRDGLIKNNWYVACLSREIKNKPLRRIIYDEPVVLFRNDAGEVGCLRDICLHRGTALSEGTIKNGCIQCPYHGWEYDSSGIVTNVPGEGPTYQNGSGQALKNRSYPTVEQDGAVWVWLGDDDKESQDDIWRFPYYGEKGWHHYYMITDFEGEVSQLVENFMDVPHTVTVHKGWFRNQSMKQVPIDVTVGDGRVLVDYKQEGDEIGVLLRPLLNPSGAPMKHTDEFIFPNITRVDYVFGDHYRYVINSQCTPVSTNKTRVYTYLAYKLRGLGAVLKPLIRFYTRRVIEQDVDIIEALKVNEHYLDKFRQANTSCDLPHLYIKKLRDLGIESEAKPFEFETQKSSLLYI